MIEDQPAEISFIVNGLERQPSDNAISQRITPRLLARFQQSTIICTSNNQCCVNLELTCCLVRRTCVRRSSSGPRPKAVCLKVNPRQEVKFYHDEG